MRYLPFYAIAFFAVIQVFGCEELFPEKKIKDCSWTARVDHDGDGYAVQATLNVEIANDSRESVVARLFVKKANESKWAERGAGIVDWDNSGVTFFSAGEELVHGEYDFKVEVLVSGVNETREASDDSDLKNQKFELSSQDAVSSENI